MNLNIKLRRVLFIAQEICDLLITASSFGLYQILNKIVPGGKRYGENSGIARDFILLAIGFLLLSPITISLFFLKKVLILLSSGE